ncbi:hypothetical protein BDZ85DRAFT_261066 [Elsinoe ampelina]|uniref:Uncharacterized protein n=1 Tax=Elsinoe ampelina TaxID=302913 RepID=A0A6A6GFL0_9PEZI|nr:hypothetical protein BDZ85DRAFT_261066 [Elsinoe ampelina]
MPNQNVWPLLCFRRPIPLNTSRTSSQASPVLLGKRILITRSTISVTVRSRNPPTTCSQTSLKQSPSITCTNTVPIRARSCVCVLYNTRVKSMRRNADSYSTAHSFRSKISEHKRSRVKTLQAARQSQLQRITRVESSAQLISQQWTRLTTSLRTSAQNQVGQN